ncbi:general secretion pathway protein K [Candidatus Photodesmus blepharus]|uniref:Type II secretion system protein K n=2 Tax=Candidatus Photodesmus blepharonis TaxID=1179155 RepID=A0A084CNK3_9GAMM|nr:general secretion pathway protein K [Candidatus Photodesmus blepharus]
MIVLMLLAVMVSIVATTSGYLFIEFDRMMNRAHYQKSYWYSIGAESLAKAIIKKSYRDSKTVNLSQPWAYSESVYFLDYGKIKGRMLDKQACFNLNALSIDRHKGNIVDKPYLVIIFQTLLKELDVDSYQAEVIADSVWEFLDKDSRVNSPTGVEDSQYKALFPAYVTPNNFIVDASELRSVYQVSGEIMEKIFFFVCALPSSDFRLNINTITTEQAKLLSAIFISQLTEFDAIDLIENRPINGWSSVNKFMSEIKVLSIDESVREQAKKYLGVDSAYFELDAEVLVEKSRIRIRSLLFSHNRDTVTVVRRRFGGISERVLNRSTGE